MIKLNHKQQQLINDKKTVVFEIKRLIMGSPYFVKSLLVLNEKFSWTWFISIAFLFFFLLPFILKYFIPSSNIYARGHKELENNIILEEYESFKKHYSTLFNGIVTEQITWDEHYEDPPFNLTKKTIVRNTGDEKDFLNHLYGV